MLNDEQKIPKLTRIIAQKRKTRLMLWKGWKATGHPEWKESYNKITRELADMGEV